MNNIYAKIIQKSAYPVFDSQGGITYSTICTYELQYPRIIHAELMTHRLFSRNAASSRAIPFNKMVEQLDGMPVRFGGNKSGMQDNGEHDELVEINLTPNSNPFLMSARDAWTWAKSTMVGFSKSFSDAGYHKQVFNRLTEPFQMIKVIVTSTEWDNFFWLRYDEAADPTLQKLAEEMLRAYLETPAKILSRGEWHLPFVHTCWENEVQKFYINDPEDESVRIYLTLEEAQKVSAARCGAVSFRNVDYTLEKSIEVYNRLLGAERKHASAFEHQAKVPEDNTDKELTMDVNDFVNMKWAPQTWEPGISHVDREGNLWSGNFKNWIQFRKLIPGEHCNHFDYETPANKMFPLFPDNEPEETFPSVQ